MIRSFVQRSFRILKRVLFYGVVGAIGFVVGAVSLYVFLLTRGPDLELWHTVELENEFSADLVEEVTTLDDYRRLEERLFEELDRRIVASTGTGPELALVRYSRNSLADPRSRDIDWNRTFELTVEAPIGGALMLHGLSDSPYSLRALAESLHARGYHVVGLRLPGHGTVPSGLCKATWRDMAAAVRLAFRDLHHRLGDRPIHVVGYSNGAALAVHHCLDALDGNGDPLPASLVLVSPAVGLGSVAAFASWQALLANLPGLDKLAWTDVAPEFDPFKYGSFAVNAGVQVWELTSSITTRVAARDTGDGIPGFPPTLAVLSAVDATVSAEAVVDNLLEHLAPGEHELMLFDINRAAVIRPLLVSDPGPLTARLLADDTLPFALSWITNDDPDSLRVVLHRKSARSRVVEVRPLTVEWPRGMLSLSHVALPFPPDDPLYGARPPARDDVLYLGHPSLQSERGLLRIPADSLLRPRHNPFFDVVEQRMLEWVEAASGGRPPSRR